MRQLVLVTFKGTTAKVWYLHGPNAAQADDVMRPIAAREDAEARAAVHPLPVPREVDADRCYNIARSRMTPGSSTRSSRSRAARVQAGSTSASMDEGTMTRPTGGSASSRRVRS